ncbi:amino acid ABC transporter, periplasmic amino acid-binding protein [Pseudonocardia sp. N23]|nr:amino acid ABC transporter, periplasmic amino acid-binding protein [Pseudonocardia sp. N23]
MGSALVLALILSACSGGNAANESTNSTPTGTVQSPAALPDDIGKRGTLRVGIAPDFAPAEFYKPGTKEIVGYDPDLITAIAGALGLRTEFVPVGYDGLIPGLQADRFDVVMSGLTDTAERQKVVSFVDYMKHYQVFVVLADNKAGVSGDMLTVCGKRLATENGSTTVDYAKTVADKCRAAGRAEPVVTTFADQTASTLALRSDRVDVAFRSPLAVPELQKATDNAFRTFKVDGIPTVLLGIATIKDDTVLLDALLAGLKSIQADGKYHRIMSGWGVSDVEFDKPGINLATTDPSAVPA